MSTAASSTAITPSPYVVGQMLNLKGSDGEQLSVTITSTYPLTTSPVMVVQLQKKEGCKEAVLKLFDRRFGDSRKENPYSNEPNLHTERAEAAWQDYVRKGLVKPLFDHIKHKEELFDQGISEDSDSDDDNEWEKLGKEEGKIHYDMQRNYTNEVQAYKELQALQGRYVPLFISSVILNMPSRPDLPPIYFQVPGVLLQKVRGFNLSDLVLALPDEPLLWEEIIQNAVDAAKAVNRAGVLNLDAQPRNIVVAKLNDRNFQSFMVDFAQSTFKWQYKDTDVLNDLSSWKCNVSMLNNPGAIGVILASEIKKTTGHKLKVYYD